MAALYLHNAIHIPEPAPGPSHSSPSRSNSTSKPSRSNSGHGYGYIYRDSGSHNPHIRTVSSSTLRTLTASTDHSHPTSPLLRARDLSPSSPSSENEHGPQSNAHQSQRDADAYGLRAFDTFGRPQAEAYRDLLDRQPMHPDEYANGAGGVNGALGINGNGVDGSNGADEEGRRRWDMGLRLTAGESEPEKNSVAFLGGREMRERRVRKRLRRLKAGKAVCEVVMGGWAIYTAIRYFLTYSTSPSPTQDTTTSATTITNLNLILATLTSSSLALLLCSLILSIPYFHLRLQTHHVGLLGLLRLKRALRLGASAVVLAPAIVNLVYTIVWHGGEGELGARCSVDVDVFWSFKDEEGCEGRVRWSTWVVLAIVRVVVTLAVVIAYYLMTSLYNSTRRPSQSRARRRRRSERRSHYVPHSQAIPVAQLRAHDAQPLPYAVDPYMPDPFTTDPYTPNLTDNPNYSTDARSVNTLLPSETHTHVHSAQTHGRSPSESTQKTQFSVTQTQLTHSRSTSESNSNAHSNSGHGHPTKPKPRVLRKSSMARNLSQKSQASQKSQNAQNQQNTQNVQNTQNAQDLSRNPSLTQNLSRNPSLTRNPSNVSRSHSVTRTLVRHPSDFSDEYMSLDQSALSLAASTALPHPHPQLSSQTLASQTHTISSHTLASQAPSSHTLQQGYHPSRSTIMSGSSTRVVEDFEDDEEFGEEGERSGVKGETADGQEGRNEGDDRGAHEEGVFDVFHEGIIGGIIEEEEEEETPPVRQVASTNELKESSDSEGDAQDIRRRPSFAARFRALVSGSRSSHPPQLPHASQQDGFAPAPGEVGTPSSVDSSAYTPGYTPRYEDGHTGDGERRESYFPASASTLNQSRNENAAGRAEADAYPYAFPIRLVGGGGASGTLPVDQGNANQEPNYTDIYSSSGHDSYDPYEPYEPPSLASFPLPPPHTPLHPLVDPTFNDASFSDRSTAHSADQEEQSHRPYDEFGRPPAPTPYSPHTSQTNQLQPSSNLIPHPAYDEFGRPYPPDEQIMFLNGYVRRMPTIESLGSREFGSTSYGGSMSSPSVRTVGTGHDWGASATASDFSGSVGGGGSMGGSRPPTRNTLHSLQSYGTGDGGGSQPVSRSNSLSFTAAADSLAVGVVVGEPGRVEREEADRRFEREQRERERSGANGKGKERERVGEMGEIRAGMDGTGSVSDNTISTGSGTTTTTGSSSAASFFTATDGTIGSSAARSG